MIKNDQYLESGMYINNIAIPTPGRTPPATDKPVVNHAGIKSNTAFTTVGPIATHKNTGNAEHKP